MKRRIEARPTPPATGRELVFDWDPQGGAIGGPDGDLVEQELARAGAWWRGVNAFHPIDLARTNASHLAALLYLMGYEPPDDIAAQLGDPEVLPDDTPDGALE